jgi:hypothetical protein
MENPVTIPPASPKLPKQEKPSLDPYGAGLPSSAPPKPKERTIGGFAENVLDDTFETLKGFYNVFVDMGKQGLSYAKNPAQWAKDMKLAYTTKHGAEAAKKIGWGFVPFSQVIDEGPGVLYDKPISAGLLEVLNTAALAGSIAKTTGAIAKASGAFQKGEKLIAIGKAIEAAPYKLAGKAFDKGIEKVSGGLLDPQKQRTLKGWKGQHTAQGLENTATDLSKLSDPIKALGAEGEAKLDRVLRAGALPGEADPGIAQAYGAWKGLVEGYTSELKARGLLTDKQIRGAMIKKIAQEMDGEINAASLLKAEERLKLLENTPGATLPLYVPNIWTGGGKKAVKIENVLDDLVTGGEEILEGKVKSLEQLKGAQGYSKKPSEYLPRAVADFNATRSRLRMADQIIESGIGKGAGLEGFKSQGVPEGVFLKYYNDPVRAKEIAGITDPTVQRFLKGEYVSTPHELTKLYDKVIRVWATQATVMNPKFHLGQWIGDAVIGAIAGSDVANAIKIIKTKAGPSQVLADVGIVRNIENVLQPKTALGRALEKASDIAQIPDKLTRAGILAKDAIPRLKKLGYSWESAAKPMSTALRSTELASDLISELRLAKERIERTSPVAQRYQRIIERLEARERKLAAKLDEINRKTQLRLEKKALASAAADEKRLARAKAQLAAQEHDFKITAGVRLPEDHVKLAAARQKVADLERKAGPFGIKRHAEAFGAGADPLFTKHLDKLNTVRQKLINLTRQRDAVVSDILATKLSVAEYQGRLADLQPTLEIMRNAIARQNTFVGDYLGLSGFEQTVIRRLIPFYAWTKAMTMLAFRLPFIAPVKTFMWHRFALMLESLTNDPDFPAQARGYIPFAVGKDGQTFWIDMKGYSPFEGLRTSNIGGVQVPNILDVVEKNPIISLIFKAKGGRTVWDVNRVTSGTPMTLLQDGSHAMFRPDGKIEQVIPPIPIVQAVSEMFPLVQQIKMLGTGYWTNKYDWKGVPQPTMDADGQYKYPKELLDRIANFAGVKIIRRTPESLKDQERIKSVSALKGLERYLPRATPEEREMILQVFQDYGNGKYHHWKSR